MVLGSCSSGGSCEGSVWCRKLCDLGFSDVGDCEVLGSICCLITLRCWEVL